MKPSKALAILISSAMAFTLAGGIAYAMEPEELSAAPIPEVAQDTSITKQVTSIVVYQDQQEAAAMAKELKDVRKQVLKTAKARHSAANDHVVKTTAQADTATTAVADTASSTATDTAAAPAATDVTATATTEDPATTEIQVEAADLTNPLNTLSHEDATVEEGLEPNSINVNGDTLSYIDYFKAASAPSKGAGLWMGSDSTTDGSWGYFIGHNPGDFTAVMTLKNGDPITVCDGDGNTRTYHVIDEFIVPDTTYWEDIESRVTQYGESVILQTCCGDNAHYRVVIAD